MTIRQKLSIPMAAQLPDRLFGLLTEFLADLPEDLRDGLNNGLQGHDNDHEDRHADGATRMATDTSARTSIRAASRALLNSLIHERQIHLHLLNESGVDARLYASTRDRILGVEKGRVRLV